MIENAGSIPLFIILALLLQSIFVLVLLIVKTGRIFQFAKSKQSSFFWVGFHDLYLNSYLTLAMCVGINSSSLSFLSPSVGVNNVIAVIFAIVIVAVPLYVPIKAIKALKQNGMLSAAGQQQQCEGGQSE